MSRNDADRDNIVGELNTLEDSESHDELGIKKEEKSCSNGSRSKRSCNH